MWHSIGMVILNNLTRSTVTCPRHHMLLTHYYNHICKRGWPFLYVTHPQTQHNHPTHISNCSSKLQKIFTNVLDNPGEPKFRQVNNSLGFFLLLYLRFLQLVCVVSARTSYACAPYMTVNVAIFLLKITCVYISWYTHRGIHIMVHTQRGINKPWYKQTVIYTPYLFTCVWLWPTVILCSGFVLCFMSHTS
jgi:hypothetical protein